MSDNVSHWRRLGDLVAFASASIALAYGAYLLVLGPETNVMSPGGIAETQRLPNLAGLLPLAIGILAFWAVATRRTIGLWAAAGIAAALALVFLFSLALQFAILAASLFLAALVSTIATRDSPGR